MRFSISLLIAASLLASPSIASAQQQPANLQQPAAGTATVTLLPPSKQGNSGSAQLEQQGNGVLVTIRALQDQTTAAILSGKCTNSAKPEVSGPAQALKPLVNGTSQTTLSNTTVTALESTPHIIIVQGGSTPLLCGDVSAVAPPAPPH